MRIATGLLSAVSLAVALAGCAKPPAVPEPVVGPRQVKPAGTELRGTIVWRQKIALTPAAIVKVWLQDMSRPGLPVPEILDEREIRTPGQAPVAFSLRYDPATIDASHTYTILVRIYEGDRTRFVNAAPYPVITRGCIDQCEVVVDAMD